MMLCVGECVDFGPPPDAILFMPPPPAPNLRIFPRNKTLCRFCDPHSWENLGSQVFRGTTEFVDFVPITRKDLSTWSVSGIDDTWLLVLVASSIGVLLFGALLAMFLLKCREMNSFRNEECNRLHSTDSQQLKIQMERGNCSSATNIDNNKLIQTSQSIIYQSSRNLADNRLVWAALTPRGTQHFISERYTAELLNNYNEAENHYETIDNLSIPVQFSYPKGTSDLDITGVGFGANVFKSSQINRPIVSSPTRIEHPNLPPLNLYPPAGNKTIPSRYVVENSSTLCNKFGVH